MAHTQSTTELGLKLGIMIHGQLLQLDHVTLKLSSSILSPFLRAEIHFQYSGGMGDLRHYVIGSDMKIGFTGGELYSEYYELDMTLIEVSLPQSVSTRSPTGDMTLRAVSRWAYHEKSLPTKAYVGVTDPNTVIKGELEDIGYGNTTDAMQPLSQFTTPVNFYRTLGALHFLQNRVLPWVQSEGDTPVYWYQTLKGLMELQSAAHMMDQSPVATLVPAYVSFDYSEDPRPIFAFLGRGYVTNPKRTDLYVTHAGYMDQGEKRTVDDVGRIDSHGRAIQIKRDLGPDSMDIWYVGYRSEEQVRANSAFLRRNHLLHQTHVLTFKELEVGTVCKVGTKVRMYDLNLYTPDAEEADAPPEDMVPSNMTSDYIVVAAHFYYDGSNEQGFTGTKLEVAKLGYRDDELGDIPEIDSYMEV